MAENNKPVESKSDYSLVRRIVNFFKLGEEGKVENFFAKQRKTMNREVQTLEKRIDTMEFSHKQKLEDYDDRIEDAEANVENAYLAVDVDSLGTNESLTEFAEVYWNKVTLAEANLDTLREDRELCIEKHNEAVKAEREQMAERKRRLSKISAKKD